MEAGLREEKARQLPARVSLVFQKEAKRAPFSALSLSLSLSAAPEVDDHLAADLLGGPGANTLGAVGQSVELRHGLPVLELVAGERPSSRPDALGRVAAGAGSSKLRVGAGDGVDLALTAAHLVWL